MKLLHSKAFTLVEILVVIVIVAVLLALFMPLSRKMIEGSKSAQCLQNVKQLMTAYHSMFSDAGKLPAAPVNPDTGATGHYNWTAYMIPQYLSAQLRCPLIKQQERSYRYTFQYAYNNGLNASYPTLSGLPVPHSRVVLVTELFYFQDGLTTYTTMNRTMRGDSPDIQISSNAGFRAQNHFGGLNLGFLDGHAELVKPDKDTWDPTSDTYAKSITSPTGLYYYPWVFGRMKTGSSLTQ